MNAPDRILCDDDTRRGGVVVREGRAVALWDGSETGLPVFDLATEPATAVPCPLLPDGAFSGLSQAAPPERAGALVRLAAAGFRSANRDWDGILLILSGGRSHWLHVSAAEVVSFQSTLTPRLIAGLTDVLLPDPETVSETLSRPERLAGILSRAERSGAGGQVAGALIGAELAAMRPYWLGQQVAVIAAAADPDYGAALQAQGVPVTVQPLLTALSLGLRMAPGLLA